MRNNEEHRRREEAQNDIVVDPHIGKVKHLVQNSPKKREQESRHYKGDELLLDVDYFSLVLILLVLRLLIKVVELESKLVDSSCESQLASPVKVKLDVDLLDNGV